MNAPAWTPHGTGAAAGPFLHTALPAAPLRACISHYWLCLNSADAQHAILPDGAVDIVWRLGAADDNVNSQANDEAGAVRMDGASPHSSRNTCPHHPQPWATQAPLVFGSSRTRTLWTLRRGSHYLGIRLQPGQARHVLDVPAWELTGTAIPADAVLRPALRGLCPLGERMGDALAASAATAVAPGSAPADAADDLGSIWAQLDAWLLAHLHRSPPRATRLDELIRHMQATPTPEQRWRIEPLAVAYGKSRRQFERQFLDAVGLSPKRFADVLRFQRALVLLAQTHWPLAQIAAELGYVDQSHFSRAFARFYGVPPARARQDAAFVQDVQHCAAQNERFFPH